MARSLRTQVGRIKYQRVSATSRWTIINFDYCLCTLPLLVRCCMFCSAIAVLQTFHCGFSWFQCLICAYLWNLGKICIISSASVRLIVLNIKAVRWSDLIGGCGAFALGYVTLIKTFLLQFFLNLNCHFRSLKLFELILYHVNKRPFFDLGGSNVTKKRFSYWKN